MIKYFIFLLLFTACSSNKNEVDVFINKVNSGIVYLPSNHTSQVVFIEDGRLWIEGLFTHNDTLNIHVGFNRSILFNNYHFGLVHSATKYDKELKNDTLLTLLLNSKKASDIKDEILRILSFMKENHLSSYASNPDFFAAKFKSGEIVRYYRKPKSEMVINMDMLVNDRKMDNYKDWYYIGQ